ncbi:Threonylcarbamoyladenosine tRNA methylthiotransferase MtaB [Candidatus Rhabdochlamydia oedothoracis]|uniref:Threonylcarbamoyladenosine tRNA methylthiotransferase MtaB n=1 Tax=Candidatus Rhabdochlamydia oedothoracis TaxID=2720720 RepID=A0ABX8V4I1_9BACT|nr:MULTISPECIES: tRNA (N(6)-L-threonylcarbamoyladenosine(37)-C(2))-methylthiotransferase MtaB [Rhabdochlamydia]KAG6559158.1 Threonylcarbamoyladenosine tRNA methylthiotransferase MtaB [Candidatus Rhabdochlamydia sp. W815]MCL6756027.1 tRNA (N(6)-L-threonylcarbamoyladenosine(37)-C(2))-methylthiotransferase MtaB [Candidatus Rhabdochlamydia oedothoracis]QYF48492.1 Threonylcarbamoyladenosine tRNA methylthiotransferase MtaB [Candidatus Rhabdochlamydia oedothoracis]
MNQKKKFKVVTLGCRTNQYESQAYQDQLLTLGYKEAKGAERVDLCIINTCTVTESADSSSRYQIRHLHRKYPDAKIVVTGCLLESAKEALQGMDEIDCVVPNKDKENLLSYVFPEQEMPEFKICQFEAHTRAFVKVQDGCNSFCTYCIIPYVRGRSRSRDVTEILQEVKGLIANGYKEIVLTGINIGDFESKQIRLADLVRQVDAIEGIQRLRISSIDPDEIDEDLAGAVLHSKHTCASMHVVLQSGSNTILKRMNRKYTREVFLETIDRLRNANPDFTFTTDVIVGFPGESELDFQDTLAMMDYVRFAKVHMFPYSPRPRTRAVLYPNRIDSAVVNTRKQQVLRLAEEHAYFLREKYVGSTLPVLIEKAEDVSSGHTENFLHVISQDKGLKSNDLVEMQLYENTPEGLLGRIV